MSPLGTAWLLAIGSRPHRPTTVDDIGAGLTDYGLTGGTLMPGVGLWRGTLERSVVAIVAGLKKAEAVAVAAHLAGRFEQEAIYLQKLGIAHLVSARRSASDVGQVSPLAQDVQPELDFAPPLSETKPPARIAGRRPQTPPAITRARPNLKARKRSSA